MRWCTSQPAEIDSFDVLPGSAADRLTGRIGLGQLTWAHVKVVSGGPVPSLRDSRCSAARYRRYRSMSSLRISGR